MKINRMSEEQGVPDWTLSLKKVASETVVEQNLRSIPVDLSDAHIVAEREAIEKCASDNSSYCYSSEWADKDVSSLKEYAIACGLPLDNFSKVSPKPLAEDIVKTASSQGSQGMIKITSEEEKPARLDIGDPFGLEDVADAQAPEAWEDIKPETKLASRPSMMTGAIKPIGGGEDYLANSNVPLASNQNSILNPHAVEDLALSSKEDTGERLAREAAEKKAAKEQEHVDWQQKLVDEMPDFHDVIKGNVFPTEVMNAQSGLNSPSSQMGVYSDWDKDSVPDQTVGETLAAQNEDRRRSIQGADKEEHEFKMSSQSGREISDPFVDSLRNALNK